MVHSPVFPFRGNFLWTATPINWIGSARSQDGEAKLALQFTEQSVALGELKITGKFIQPARSAGRAVSGGARSAGGRVKIPTGSYNQPDILLEQNGVEAFSAIPGQMQVGRGISVDDKTPAVLNAGGPLTNSVTASRHGQDLRLDYRLIGAGGETYQLAKPGSLQAAGVRHLQGRQKNRVRHI